MRSSTLAALMALLAALAALLGCAAAWANPQPDSASSSRESAGSGQHSATLMPAAWTPKELNFTYQQAFTTKYSCDGLRQRMTEVLGELGAQDVHLRSMGCAHLVGPDVFPGVHIRMSVLVPAREWVIGRTVPAHWKRVDLVSDRNVADPETDCELMQQIKQKLLPLFATRKVDYSAVCQKKTLLPGGTVLKAEVLVPDRSAAAAAVTR